MTSKQTNGKKVAAQPASASVGPDGLIALMYQLLETELGGVQVYRNALACALHPALRAEWERNLVETERHCVIARRLVAEMGLDPDGEIPARLVCRHLGDGLVKAMMEALAVGSPAEAQLTAAECVVTAETKDHQNWELIGKLAKTATGKQRDLLQAAYDEVEPQEDQHLYNTKAWALELWTEAVGLQAELPPRAETERQTEAVEAENVAMRSKKSVARAG